MGPCFKNTGTPPLTDTGPHLSALWLDDRAITHTSQPFPSSSSSSHISFQAAWCMRSVLRNREREEETCQSCHNSSRGHTLCVCACFHLCCLRVNVRGLSGISVTRVMAQECKARGNIKPVLSQNAFVAFVPAPVAMGIKGRSLG